MIRAVVLDIEGTTSSLSHFRERLVPLASQRLPGWLKANLDAPGTAVFLGVRGLGGGGPPGGAGSPADARAGGAAQDAKTPPLKDIQGLIWAEALARGELAAHFYADVPLALQAWCRRGLRVYVYSSGSVLVQRAWFGHCPGGSLLPYLSGHFDTRDPGSKLAPASYQAIAAAAGVAPGAMLFLSDAPAELDAAAVSGWQTALVQRDDGPPGASGPDTTEPATGGHRRITSFSELAL